VAQSCDGPQAGDNDFSICIHGKILLNSPGHVYCFPCFTLISVIERGLFQEKNNGAPPGIPGGPNLPAKIEKPGIGGAPDTGLRAGDEFF
jgi:hypothetical protein